MDLIPFYARLAATLTQVLDDMGPMLVDILVRDFRFQVRKKDQVHVHSKIKNARFIGTLQKWEGQDRSVILCRFLPNAAELTKFGLCPKPQTMKCITVGLLHICVCS